MAIQWSLVIFTALTGLGGWMFACVALDSVAGRNQSKSLTAALVSLAAIVVGGIASVTHLSHPERMLAALGHPTSGIFTEAVLVGLSSACIIVFAILAAKGASAGARKAFAVLGAVFGIVLSFMAGYSYMMSSTAVWDNILLPVGYLCTAIPAGVAAYLAVVGAEREAGSLRPFAILLIVGGILAAVASIAWPASAGAVGSTAAFLAASIVLAGGIPAVCGALMTKRPEQALVLALIALIACLVGMVCFRCMMWEAFDLTAVGAPFFTDFSAM